MPGQCVTDGTDAQLFLAGCSVAADLFIHLFIYFAFPALPAPRCPYHVLPTVHSLRGRERERGKRQEARDGPVCRR